MITNILKNRVQIQQKSSEMSAVGEVVEWEDIVTKYAAVIPLDARARAIYQQMNSHVTHKIVLRGRVNLAIGENRIIQNGTIYEPVDPPLYIENSTIIVVKEV